MSEASRNHGLWAGPLLGLAGLLSYFTIIPQWPSLRDMPWLNLVVLAAAVAISASALLRAWRKGGALRRLAGVGGAAFTLACTSLLVFYVFSYSYGLPDVSLALPEAQPVPALTLLDDRSQPVDLAALGQRAVVMVFFRGHW